MPIYCDESGNTGYNLLENNQPYFVYSALNIEEDEAKEFVAYLKNKYNLQGELKGKNLVKSNNGQRAIMELFEKYSKCVQIVYHHKKYTLACKYFEYVFEPAVYENSQVFYYTKFHRFIANLVYVAYEKSPEYAENLFLRFQELLRGNDPDGLFKMLQSDFIPNDLTSMIAEFTLLNKKTIFEEIITEGKYNYWVLDLAQTALHSLLSVWSMKIGALTVIVDESQQLREMEVRNNLFHRLEDELVYHDPFGEGETALNFSLKERITFASSKNKSGLQLADLFASSVYYTLMHPKEEFSKSVRSYNHDYIPSPNNLCIEPQPGIYLSPDSIEFAQGIVTLKYLVELSRESTEHLGIRYSNLMLKKIMEYQRKEGLNGPNYTAPKKKRKKRK